MQSLKFASIRRFALALLLSPAVANAAIEWISLYKAGEEMLRAGQIEPAQRQLSLALGEAEVTGAKPQDTATILDAIGRTWFRGGKFARAALSFERALQLWGEGEGRVPLLCNAAQAYREEGTFAKAEKHIREALVLAPAAPQAWRLLGSVLIGRRKFSEAEAAERRALALGDSSIAIAVWGDLAMIQEANGNHAECAKHLKAAISLAQPGYQRARLLGNLGAAELKLRLPGESLVHLRASLEEMEAVVGSKHPDVAGILELYSRALSSQRRKVEAQQAAHRAKEIRAFLASSVDWRELK